jgi:hypothetical protein
MKGEIHEKEITIINPHAPNVSTPNFIKHTLKDLKEHLNSNTMAMGELLPSKSEISIPQRKKFWQYLSENVF